MLRVTPRITTLFSCSLSCTLTPCPPFWYSLLIKRFTSHPALPEAVVRFTKKVGKIQKKFGIKGTSKYLSVEREKWHLRQKQNESKDHISVNKEFKSINPDKDIVNFIDSNKLGRRRPERKIKETRVMKYKKEYIPKLKFVAAATKASSFLPEDESMLEVAFVGRSNVGKSTLINAFTSSGVARTSDTPGETRSINWYKWASKMFIVDLPGYGFSYSSVDKKQTWVDLMKDYISTRKTLRRVMVLLDARHGIKSSDLEMLDLLNEGKKKFQIVLTKVDTVEPLDLARRCTLVNKQTKKYKLVVSPVMMVSAKKNMGMDRLRGEVERFMQKREIYKPTPHSLKSTEGSQTNHIDGPSKTKANPTLKSLWRKDEERKKQMITRKLREHGNQPLETDEQGNVFKHHQRYKSKLARSKRKKM